MSPVQNAPKVYHDFPTGAAQEKHAMTKECSVRFQVGPTPVSSFRVLLFILFLVLCTVAGVSLHRHLSPMVVPGNDEWLVSGNAVAVLDEWDSIVGLPCKNLWKGDQQFEASDRFAFVFSFCICMDDYVTGVDLSLPESYTDTFSDFVGETPYLTIYQSDLPLYCWNGTADVTR